MNYLSSLTRKRPGLIHPLKSCFFYFMLSYTSLSGQASQGFEGITTTLNCGGLITCLYFDSGSAAAQHFLADYTGGGQNIPVSQTGSAGVLGFMTEFTPTRTGTAGANGLTEGDAFGVAGPTEMSGNLGSAAPEGTQGFLMEDTDGWVTMYFDYVDLTGTTSPMFSMQYHLEATSWEFEGQVGVSGGDRLYVRIEIDNCTSATTIELLDTDGGGSGGGSGGDIDDMNIEDVWTMLSSDLTAFIGCRAQLIIEFDSDSSSEELGIDAISFTEGTRQSAFLPVELLDFDAKVQENDVHLHWQTATELNNYGFELERSANGRDFELVHFIEGHGTTTVAQSYSYQDKNLRTG